jgi:hypothetical protein
MIPRPAHVNTGVLDGGERSDWTHTCPSYLGPSEYDKYESAGRVSIVGATIRK